ncbi:MAG: DNA repair protein RadC [Acidobacteria bacterium]|nr:DNA repair protein RadC [Acidobacteriota bacterium]
MTRVAELLPEERPREKLLSRGAGALSDVELLAVLLRTGIRGEPVLEYSRRWLEEAGGLTGLAALDAAELQVRPGIGAAKSAELAAALELGRRLAYSRLEDRPLLDRPELVADYIVQRHGRERVEVFGVLCLDARHRLVRDLVLHRGARTHTTVEPSEVFRRGITEGANGVIVWHTHPSGDPSPSEDDLDLTRRLVQAGKLLSIAVLDHLVVAGGGFVSLRQRGVIASA